MQYPVFQFFFFQYLIKLVAFYSSYIVAFEIKKLCKRNIFTQYRHENRESKIYMLTEHNDKMYNRDRSKFGVKVVLT